MTLLNLWSSNNKPLQKRPEWNENDSQFLIDNYLIMPTREIAKEIGFTESYIYSMVRSLREEGRIKTQSRKESTKNRWCANEELYLMDNYMRLTFREIANDLGRSMASVGSKVAKMGLRKEQGYRPVTKPQKNWTEEDKSTLKKMHENGSSIPEICLKLGRTRSSIGGMISRLKLPSKKVWSDEELLYIKQKYKTMTGRAIAMRLKRSPSAISKKIREFKENE